MYLVFCKKGVVIAVTLCVLFACSLFALAVAIPAINDFVYAISPDFAEHLYPIQQSAIDSGIKVEVLYAANDNRSAVVYFTVQDVTGKKRLDETLDFCDACQIDDPCAFTVTMLSFKKENNTASFIMQGDGGEGMSGKMTRFHLKHVYER